MKRDARDGVCFDAVGKTGAERMIELLSEGWGEVLDVSAASCARCEIGGSWMERGEQKTAQGLRFKNFTKK